MKKHDLNETRHALTMLLAATLAFVFIMLASSVITSADTGNNQNEDRQEVIVEVVEEIPAADIEDADVPLAGMPSSALSKGVRHMGMMLLLLIASVVYAVYFISFEKRLVLLRQQAAEAEARAMRKRRQLSKRGEADER